MFNRAFIRSPHGVNFARETMSAARRGGSGCGCGGGGGQAADWHYSRAQVTRDSNASNPPSALARPPPRRRPLECGRARASVRRAVAVASVSLDCADLNEWSWLPPPRLAAVLSLLAPLSLSVSLSFVPSSSLIVKCVFMPPRRNCSRVAVAAAAADDATVQVGKEEENEWRFGGGGGGVGGMAMIMMMMTKIAQAMIPLLLDLQSSDSKEIRASLVRFLRP